MGGSQISSAALDKAEKEYLLFAGIDQFWIENVQISDNEQDYIHTIDFWDKNIPNTNPKLLIFHGFAGSGCMFAKMITDLRQKYRVTTIDFLGMGCSGRPKFKVKNENEAIDFFIDSVQKWIEKTNYTEKFHLLGHSFGGYIATKYALKYPVEKLVLLSPVGVPKKPSKKSFKFRNFIWQTGFNPVNVIRMANKIGRLDKALTDYVNQRTLIRTEEEKSIFKEFMKQQILRPESSENAITYVLDGDKYAKQPLSEEFPKLQNQTIVIFGDDDWIEQQLRESGQEIQLTVQTVEIAGHHLHMDNHVKTNYHVMSFLDGEAIDEYLIEKQYEF